MGSISRRSRRAKEIEALDLVCIRAAYEERECDPAVAWRWLRVAPSPKLWVADYGWRMEICFDLYFYLGEYRNAAAVFARAGRQVKPSTFDDRLYGTSDAAQFAQWRRVVGWIRRPTDDDPGGDRFNTWLCQTPEQVEQVIARWRVRGPGLSFDAYGWDSEAKAWRVFESV